jgi:hypothetical protein
MSITVTMPDNSTSRRFATLSQDDQAVVVEGGMHALDAGRAHVERAFVGEWAERLRTSEAVKVEALTQEYQTREHQLRTAMSDMKAVQQDLLRGATAAETERRITAEQQLSAQSARIAELQETLYSRMKTEGDGIRAEYEHKLAAAVSRETEARDALMALTVRRTKSTTKGVDGENTVGGLLHQLFPTAEVEDCRSQGGLGDFTLLQGDVCMMVEVKNYKRNVSRAEIEKFVRDMGANPQYTCGVLASLESGVAGHADFSLETVEGRPVVFLHNVADTPEKLQYAFSVFEMVHSIENLDLRKQSAVEAVQREIVDKARRSRQLRSIAEKHANELSTWSSGDEAKSVATLRLVANLSA